MVYMNDAIRKLQNQIEAEQRKIANCNHAYGEAFYNPETVKEPYGERVVTQGVHLWYEPTGYRDVEKARWTRKCTKCGREDHTYKQKPVIASYKPDFGP